MAVTGLVGSASSFDLSVELIEPAALEVAAEMLSTGLAPPELAIGAVPVTVATGPVAPVGPVGPGIPLPMKLPMGAQTFRDSIWTCTSIATPAGVRSHTFG